MQLFFDIENKKCDKRKVGKLSDRLLKENVEKTKKGNTEFLTVKELAERYGVEQRVAHGWCQRGLFPNATKETGKFFDYWQIPESDLKDFVAQKRKGRPSKKLPEPAAED